ncbi:HNH endonuclease [Streptomyces sp. NPDC057543]|uniref:HNH endonuclease n=1 Tax=Streptomyces sp. NPDC057543 TaxID=3346163 RepID=UPI0036B77002
MAGNPRNGRPYRRLVDWPRAQHLPCWLCGHNIDGTLNAKHSMSFTLDHLVPLSKGGDLLDPANARPAHRRCNSKRGNRTSIKQPRASRRW